MFKIFGGEKPDETPFQKLEKIGEGKYFEVKVPTGNPDVVVKVARTKWKKGDEEGVHPLADPDCIKSDFDMLKNNFGEYLPNSQFVIGKNERDEKTVYIIQDRVDGSSLENLEYDENVAEQLKSFLSRVIDIYISNLFYHGKDRFPRSVFPDLKGGNFIFGKDKKRNDQNDRLYFIDTYPIEGDYPHNFVNRYMTLIKGTFSKDYGGVIDEFKKEATDRIKKYLEYNKDKIERTP